MNKIPKKEPEGIYIGVDLAVKEEETNDFTAIVVGKLFVMDDRKVLFIDHIINKRMNFPAAIHEIATLAGQYRRSTGIEPEVLIEDVGMQSAWQQQLCECGVAARAIKIGGASKRTRLSTTSQWVKDGRILFRKHGLELLIEQIVGFGVEKHDDLADALSLLAIEVLSSPPESMPEVWGF